MAGFKRRAIEASESGQRPALLGDLAGQGVDVFCWCNRCSHHGVVSAERLSAELGPTFPVPEVGARMRCTGCGSKDVATRPNWPGRGVVASHAEDPREGSTEGTEDAADGASLDSYDMVD